jgi:hypothetical protein
MSTSRQSESHTVTITRSVSGNYGWSIEITADGASVEALRDTVERIRTIEAELRAASSRTV